MCTSDFHPGWIKIEEVRTNKNENDWQMWKCKSNSSVNPIGDLPFKFFVKNRSEIWSVGNKDRHLNSIESGNIVGVFAKFLNKSHNGFIIKCQMCFSMNPIICIDSENLSISVNCKQ